MDLSFGKQSLVFDKRFWILPDQADININFSGNRTNLKFMEKNKSNCKKHITKSKSNGLKVTQNQRTSNNVGKTTCLKVWTLATNLTLILICVGILSGIQVHCQVLHFEVVFEHKMNR